VRKLATLKQFALLIAVNPFVTGCGKRGRDSQKPFNEKKNNKGNRFAICCP